MSLLGDTPFLDQLASSTSLLTDNIAKTDTAQETEISRGALMLLSCEGDKGGHEWP